MSRDSTPGTIGSRRSGPSRSVTPSVPSPLSLTFELPEGEYSEDAERNPAQNIKTLENLGLSAKALRIIEILGLPHSPVWLYDHSSCTTLYMAYVRYSQIVKAKELFKLKKENGGWPSDIRVIEEDIVNLYTNKTTWGDWRKTLSQFKADNPKHTTVLEYLQREPGETRGQATAENEVFHPAKGSVLGLAKHWLKLHSESEDELSDSNSSNAKAKKDKGKAREKLSDDDRENVKKAKERKKGKESTRKKEKGKKKEGTM